MVVWGLAQFLQYLQPFIIQLSNVEFCSAVMLVYNGSQMFLKRAMRFRNKYRLQGWQAMGVYRFWEAKSPKIPTVQWSNSSGRMQFLARTKIMCGFQFSFPKYFTVHLTNHQSIMHGILISYGVHLLRRNWSRAWVLGRVSPRFPNRRTSLTAPSCPSRIEFCSTAEHVTSPAVVRNSGDNFHHLHNGQPTNEE